MMKIFWKIFSGLLASLLSLFLVLSLISFPAISFITDNAAPEKLVDIIISSGMFSASGTPSASNHQILLSSGTVESSQSPADLETFLQALGELANRGIIDVEQLMENLEIPADAEIDLKQMAQELIESTAMQTLVATYAEDIINAATGTGESPVLTTDTVMDILDPHIDEIVSIVENNLPADVKIDRENLTAAIDKAAGTALPSLIDALPPAQEIADALVSTNPQLSKVMRDLNFVYSGQLRLIALGIIVVLLILVFLLRLPGFNGLRWIGISGLVGAVFTGALGYLLQAKPVLNSLSSALADISSLVMPLLSSLASTFVIFAIIYGVAGLILVVGNGVLNVVIAKKEQ
jgi:hypothetical protein